MKVVEDAGDSSLKAGQIVTPRELRDENSLLNKRNDKKTYCCSHDAYSYCNSSSSRYNKSIVTNQIIYSAASFQETTKVLNEGCCR
jgi:DNA-directed RNA polymerase subunit beta'